MMGAGLAKAAYSVAYTQGLREHAPVRVYVFMALTALDNDANPTYFAGRASLAESLAIVPGTTSAIRAVDRAVGVLANYGLISTLAKSAPGRHSRYAILDGEGNPLRPKSPAAMDTASRGVNDHGSDTARRGLTGDGRIPLNGRMHTGFGAEHTPLSGALRKKEDKEEEGRASATPTRSCRIHSTWEHSKPCRACANDRRAAEAAPDPRRDSTMSPRVLDCGTGNHRRLNDGTCMICENTDPLWEVA
ncbi:hypothetical protein GCM10009860_11560 [Microbacterium mitrae]